MKCDCCQTKITTSYFSFNGEQTYLCKDCRNRCVQANTLIKCPYHSDTLLMIDGKRVKISGLEIPCQVVENPRKKTEKRYFCQSCDTSSSVWCDGPCNGFISLGNQLPLIEVMNPYEYSSLVICKQCYKPDAKRCSVCGSPAATSDGKTLYPGARCIGKDINKVDQYRCAFCNES